MNFIIKSSCVAIGRRPIHKMPLDALLVRFGVEKVRDPADNNPRMFGRRIKRTLWDVWELVKSRWQLLRKKLHPDVSGYGYEVFAVMSAVHDTIIQRLRKRGIGA
jgi:hypothetical protein